jgi:hypothetical protein
LRISDDGAGGTSIALVPRGASVLAVSADWRAALTALHARGVSFESGHARLGEDFVVFVGGPGDRRTSAAVAAPASGPAWALLPIARDAGTFGMAIVRVDDPPRVDEPVLWSMYPNGLDPAPVAAVSSGARTWVARVLPSDAAPGAARMLEIGEVDAAGTFALRDVVPTGVKPTDLAIAPDSQGALWLAWVDGGASWLERTACAAAKGSK